MKVRRPASGAALLAVFAVTIALAWPPSGARAQVPYVPTPLDVVERMLELANVTARDFVIDLGSGDGRVVRTAAKKYGARGLGVDLDPDLVARSRELARRDGIDERVSFVVQDLFETRIADASVVTMYLLQSVNLKLRPRLLAELAPGTRVVSHDFDLGDWEPDQKVTVYSPHKFGGSGGNSTLHLWIVPAQVGGTWRWQLRVGRQTADYELDAVQRFQHLEGVVRSGGREWRVEQGRVRGDTVTFTVTTDVGGSAIRHEFNGRIAGDALHGNVIYSGPRIQGSADWSGTRGAQRASSTGRRAMALTALAR